MSGEGTERPRGSSARPCPICGRPADPGLRPFCSKRCADVDLHRWLSESYRIPAAGSDDGLDADEPGSTDDGDERESR